MKAIRKVVDITGDTLIIPELNNWREKQVEIIILPLEKIKKKEERPFGLAKGQFEVTEAFFEPLPEDIQLAFEGK